MISLKYFFTKTFFSKLFLHSLYCYDITNQCLRNTNLIGWKITMEKNLFLTDYLNILKVFRSLNTKPSDALRDIADNGYDAGATELRVHLEEKKLSTEQRRNNGKQLDRIVISDNGRGMTEFEILKSLVPAETGRERNLANDLGYFGIGLISSGLSVGNVIQVYTRSASGCFYSYIDYREKQVNPTPVNLVRECTEDEIQRVLNPYLRRASTGTVVILSDLCRLPASRNVVDDLRKQTEVAFARGYYNLKDKLSVFVNGNAVRFYDPLEKSGSVHLSPVYIIPVTKDKDGNKIDESITVQFSVIKSRNSKRIYPKYQNPSLATQGFSVIRNGRELCWAQNFDMWAPTPPKNAFRGIITYEAKQLDELIFDVDVNKSSIKIINKEIYAKIDALRHKYFSEEVEPRYQNQRATNAENREDRKNTVSISSMRTIQTTLKLDSPNKDSNLVVDEIKSIDLDELTFKDAFTKIEQWQSLLKANN